MNKLKILELFGGIGACSDTQLYKQAGNSIVVNVLVALLNNLLKGSVKNEKTN